MFLKHQIVQQCYRGDSPLNANHMVALTGTMSNDFSRQVTELGCYSSSSVNEFCVPATQKTVKLLKGHKCVFYDSL